MGHILHMLSAKAFYKVSTKFCMRIHVDMKLMAGVSTEPILLGCEKDFDHTCSAKIILISPMSFKHNFKALQIGD